MGEYICNSSHGPKLRTVCYTKAVRGVDHDAGRGRDLHDAGRRRCRIAGVIAVVEQASGTTFEVRPTSVLWVALSGRSRHGRSGELTGLCGAATERAPGVRRDTGGDRRRQQRERVLR
jgi:hypothetical protein